ncbi:MAG: PRD domain-containing protein [Propionibacterium sp.]|nr:PRD domain-containing protein [Propionibacterium sp.]
MEILKVLNNNVVLASDSAGSQVILTGRGLGFQKSAGQHVDQNKIVQVFRPSTREEYVTLRDFLVDLPPEYIDLAKMIVKAAEDEWQTTFQQALIVALADHLVFAVKRAQTGNVTPHPLRGEVSHLFPNEYRMAQRAITMVRETGGLQISDEDSVALTLHFVNAMAFATNDLSKTFAMTEILSQVFEVLETAYNRSFPTDDVNSARFITHLRYFFSRAANGQQLRTQASAFNDSVRDSFPEASQAAQKVRAVLEMRLGTSLTDDEATYLILHIARLAAE